MITLQPNQLLAASISYHSNRSARATRITSSGGRSLVDSGRVQRIEPREAWEAVKAEGFKILDVRPRWERDKAYVQGSLHVPLFVRDESTDIITLVKKWVHFGYVGLWTGQSFTEMNPEFVEQVEDLVPDKEEKLLVACGEGLRSLLAISKLHGGGYRSLGWLAGGFNRSADRDFPETEGREKLQYATIGGVSYYFLKLLILLQGESEKST